MYPAAAIPPSHSRAWRSWTPACGANSALVDGPSAARLLKSPRRSPIEASVVAKASLMSVRIFPTKASCFQDEFPLIALRPFEYPQRHSISAFSSFVRNCRKGRRTGRNTRDTSATCANPKSTNLTTPSGVLCPQYAPSELIRRSTRASCLLHESISFW